MNTDKNKDRLVDMLLWELVGQETPPDMRERVLQAAIEQRQLERMVSRKPIQRALVKTQFKRLKAPALAIAAILTLLCIAGALFQSQSVSASRTPILTSAEGEVSRDLGIVLPGETLSTGSNSSAKLTYRDGSVVELTPGSTIVITSLSRWNSSKGIKVLSGEIHAEIAPQPSGHPFLLNSQDARVEVVGTEFSFGLRNDNTRLEVMEGAVRFISRETGREALVKTGFLAEAGKSGFRHEKIPLPGIIRFTLMNAETDQPMSGEPLASGEVISLSALPTKKINIRADYEGEAPFKVITILTRQDGRATGLSSHASAPQEHPPFFVAGDHWKGGQPDDCKPWTPRPGIYQLSAEAIYPEDSDIVEPEPLFIQFRITK